MDRMLYLSMGAAKNTLVAQTVNSHNLANASTTGFRQDLSQFRSMPVFGEVFPSRVYAMEETPAINFDFGAINRTGNDLDVAINDQGFFVVQSFDGSEAYSRRGDFRVNIAGLLENGAGQLVMGDGGPIAIPQSEKIEIGTDGTITSRPTGQDEKTLATIGRLRLVNPPLEQLVKGEDGLLRLKDGTQTPDDAAVTVTSGGLESSNVNVIQSMIKMIELARQFEMDIKAMSTVQENDEYATRILSFS